MQPSIIVHGGAGAWANEDADLGKALIACEEAAEAGRRILLAGGKALDAVEAAVRSMEDSPFLQAGRGSHQNRAGRIQMDAFIMDGASLNLGAVAAVELIRNPVSLARKVMEVSEHSFLVAGGANDFAEATGAVKCELDYLLNADGGTGSDRRAEPRSSFVALPDEVGDTVGAVALDVRGNVAAATSTGGTKGKAQGRVGDSPLAGSGGYADSWSGAASATGHGESLMKVVISKRVCDLIASGVSARKACETAIEILHARVNGFGGVIAVDIRGGVGFARNTAAMPYAYAAGAGQIQSGQ